MSIISDENTELGKKTAAIELEINEINTEIALERAKKRKSVLEEDNNLVKVDKW